MQVAGRQLVHLLLEPLQRYNQLEILELYGYQGIDGIQEENQSLLAVPDIC